MHAHAVVLLMDTPLPSALPQVLLRVRATAPEEPKKERKKERCSTELKFINLFTLDKS